MTLSGSDAATVVRSIAFYLPQFHPVPENDEWWGKGFTEWTNVSKAQPIYPRHYQPHLPADLGFYDLRLPEARQAQADLAHDYGVTGFCYYHYWFNGRRILQRPFEEVLASGKPDLPFCLAWANENWTRIWDGLSKDLLLGQTYSDADDDAHIQALLPALHDPRYITIDSRPLLLIYRASYLPDSRRTTDRWRAAAKRSGLPDLYLARMDSGPQEGGDPRVHGFDASVEFQPRWWDLPPTPLPVRALQRYVHTGVLGHQVRRYENLVDHELARPSPDYPWFPTVTPSWDNTARKRRHGLILHGANPEDFERWLTAAAQRVRDRPADERIVFINAWNEWAEGNHLEPDQRFGRRWLEAHSRAVAGGRVAR